MLCAVPCLLLFGLVAIVRQTRIPCIFFVKYKLCAIWFTFFSPLLFFCLWDYFLYILWRHSVQIAHNRLCYIKDWLGLLYVYKNVPVTFQGRCKLLAHVKQFCKYKIINHHPIKWTIKKKWRKMTTAEKNLICLMDAGFSNRELCAIFQVGKVGSIYVKYYRIKLK